MTRRRRFVRSSPVAAKRSAIALSAARGGDRDACRYLFVRFGEELYDELVRRGIPTEYAEAQVIALFGAIPYEQDADFDSWLSQRAGPATFRTVG